ncbi:MAG: hypothetical protein IJ390_00355 [Lachnospiraceae bacterium]|nr:hypothetical protein [Lachnospiraceae bacterium]
MKNKSPKQIAALICIALLVLLYLATLISAVFAFPGWERMFGGCLVATIALPILLWIYIQIYARVKEQKELANELKEDMKE